MPKFMFQGSYTPSGAAGLMKEGGSGRARETESLVQGLGGKVEAYYFAFGEVDFVLIADLPDDASAVAASLTAGSSGAIKVTTTRLLTPSDIDAASGIDVGYRAPGD